MLFVAADAGLSGALCAFDLDRGPVEVIDMPLIQDGRKTMQLDVKSMCRWLHGHEPARVVLERTAPMPALNASGGRTVAMGAVSAFRSGLVYGQLRAVCEANGIPLSLVTAVTWKKWHHLTGPDKEQGRQLALKLYPQCAEVLRRKMDHNRAEACLIASWGASHWRGLEAGTV